ncbi:DNA-3-methyladenine glycosylase 2 family protein, partial [Streptomyces sp. SID335]|nr:DNA-3-methyladenine glycosylase 2 family protein [Streptomyces sp. SID335]
DRDDAEAALRALGVDARTAAVIRMRALGDPDVALPGGPERALDAWRPWRSYALRHLALGGGA